MFAQGQGGMAGCGALNNQLQGTMQAQSNGYTQTPAPPRTLASGLSSLDELNKRLSGLASAAYNLASLLGGPYPTSTGEKPPGDASQPSTMERLNEAVITAHTRLTEIESAISAMSRSLGSN